MLKRILSPFIYATLLISFLALTLLIVGITAGVIARTKKVDILVTTFSPGTYIYFNEKEYGIAPLCVPNVPPGTHTIRAVSPDDEYHLGFGFAPTFAKAGLPDRVITTETSQIGIEAVDCDTWRPEPIPPDPVPPTGDIETIDGDTELLGLLIASETGTTPNATFNLYAADGVRTNDLQRTAKIPFSETATITVYAHPETMDGFLTNNQYEIYTTTVSLDEFLAVQAKAPLFFYDITVKNGEIVSLAEHYIP